MLFHAPSLKPMLSLSSECISYKGVREFGRLKASFWKFLQNNILIYFIVYKVLYFGLFDLFWPTYL